ncbi:MAG: ROK family protein [Bacteroidota bacterium]
MDRTYVIGIDIGGTSAAVGLVNRDGQLLAQRKYLTAEHPQANWFVSAVQKGVADMLSELSPPYRVCGIGVGVPNGNYYTGRIEYAPNLPWKGVVDLAGLMQDALGYPVVLTNDANAAALGEKHFGAAKDRDDFIVITIGTGLGSGIVTNGKLIYGSSGFGGEVGHTTAIRDGRLCSCGKHGCLETYVSARGLRQNFFDQLAQSSVPSAWRNRPQGEISARTVFEAAHAGDEAAIAAFDYTGRILGRHLADVVAITSPEVIFLYGGVAEAGDLLLEPTRQALDAHLLQVFRGRVRVEASQLEGKSAAILGAAALAWDELCRDIEEHESA